MAKTSVSVCLDAITATIADTVTTNTAMTSRDVDENITRWAPPAIASRRRRQCADIWNMAGPPAQAGSRPFARGPRPPLRYLTKYALITTYRTRVGASGDEGLA
ncbi:hypothetical protein Adi01nite_04090 [Amorphoplanes digitatis]|nr:hypothetical protein Adi01nite_04090 [Actinoplanes digitatis]